jgi:hypothetical protein
MEQTILMGAQSPIITCIAMGAGGSWICVWIPLTISIRLPGQDLRERFRDISFISMVSVLSARNRQSQKTAAEYLEKKIRFFS